MQIIQLLIITNFLHPLVTSSLSLRFKYFPQHPVLKYPQSSDEVFSDYQPRQSSVLNRRFEKYDVTYQAPDDYDRDGPRNVGST